ncbi:MAG: aromatic amino acid ammonia-lyase [Planctomycetota bacterium]
MTLASKAKVVLNGYDLTIDEIVAVGVGDKHVSLDESAVKRCQQSRAFLAAEIEQKRIIYGVNTSFGPMCNKIIDDDQLSALQLNLIRSHAAGLGEPLQHYIALASLVVRLNALVKGYSGIRVEVLELLEGMINAGIAPYVPSNGSVGASGDLVHLAHMALALIGEGKVFLRGQLTDAKEALKSAGLKPVKLTFKEGIALMNGTSVMTALSAFVLFGARKLLNIGCVTAAFAMEIFGGIDDAFDEDLHRVKPHPGQVKIAEMIRNLYRGSENITLRENMHDLIRQEATDGLVYETSINVQEVYSIRCTPQILAPVYEAIEKGVRTIECEANSSNDNPIIIPEKKKIIHGGNFHGQSIAYEMDSLCMAVSTLCNISERRINKLLDKKLNEGLPEHLISGTPGLNMGFMGAQYLATSTTAENRQLANPVGVHSISCNASNQDVVSMGTVAARKAYRSVSNAKHVITLEILADLQALSFRNAETMGYATKKIYQTLAEQFEVYDDRRVFHDDLVKLRKRLFSSQLFDNLEIFWKGTG